MGGKTHYLYGAAVQGIQSFIFQTNALRDIVGASELVEEICDKMFNEFVHEGEDDLILHAAGNIKCIFSDKTRCEKAVLSFPRKVLDAAPGITISQAVVEYEEGQFEDVVELLEQRLRAQRNMPFRSLTTGLMAIERSRTTGLPVVRIKKTENGEEHLDAATEAKLYEMEKRKKSTSSLCEKCFGVHLTDWQIAYDIEKLTEHNDWIAVIHADGNGLGQIVQKIGKKKDVFSQFSKLLNEATILAARDTFQDVSENFRLTDKFIIRPVILGGDDLTVICRGDVAVFYASAFLKRFEEWTKKKLSSILSNDKNKVFGIDHLTACAGIAFIKSSYPFYYGYELAESLCSEAKKEAKKEDIIKENGGLAPSCLMFHKVQDSFVEDYDSIVRRELTPQSGHSWKFGPYYINEEISKKINRWTIDNLTCQTDLLNGREGNAVKSGLRQWMGLMHENVGAAAQKKARMAAIYPSFGKYIETVALRPRRDGTVDSYPVYDMLALHSITYKVTKKK